MDAKLKTIRYLKVLKAPKDGEFFRRLKKSRNTASFHERLVFSYLAYRDRIGKAATVRRIAHETSLSPRTVQKSLASLGNMVQCETAKTQKKWSPVTPPDGMFGLLPDPDGNHWSDRYQYMKLFVPRKGTKIKHEAKTKRFGLFHSAVYSQLLSLAGRKTSVVTCETGLSTLLNGVTRRTISTVLNDLDHLGLLSREKVGDRLRIYLLPITKQHLELFRPLPKGEKIKVSPPKPPADPNDYQLKGDCYDEWRTVCKGMMTQSYAEKAIQMSVELYESFDRFREFVLDTKKWHEQNKLEGKITKGHFGRFLVKRYRGRLEEYRRREAEAEALEKLLQHFNSDEYRAKVEAERAEAAADPLHKKHEFSVDSVTDRVRFSDSPIVNRKAADRIISDLERHLLVPIFDSNEFDPREVRLKAHEVSVSHLTNALSKINDHFDADTWATPEEFVNAINGSLQSVKGRSLPAFEWDNGEQHA